MAEFVITFRMSPAEYKALTVEERDALIEVQNEMNRRK